MGDKSAKQKRNDNADVLVGGNVITTTIELLQQENYYGVSHRIEIAKGKYQYVRTFKQMTRKFRRAFEIQKRSRLKYIMKKMDKRHE